MQRTSTHVRVRDLERNGIVKLRSALARALRTFGSRVGLFAFALTILTSSVAWADARVAVRAFKGPKGAQVRAVVLSELAQRGVEVVSNREIDRVAKVRGVRADDGTARSEISRELTVHAWIDGRVTRQGKSLTAILTVQDASGVEVAQLTVTRKASRLVPSLRREFWGAAGPGIEKAQATPLPVAAVALPPDAPEPAVQVAADSATQVAVPNHLAWPGQGAASVVQSDESKNAQQARSSDSKAKPGLSAIEAAVSINTLARTLRFRNAYVQGASDYELAAAPLVMASIRLYPGAFTRSIWASCIGLDGSVQRAFSLGSQSADGVRYKTKFEGSTGSLVGRMPFAGHEVNLLAGYGFQRFLITDVTGASAPVPGVQYRHLRAGGAGRFALGTRVKLGFEADWLVILGTGPLGSSAWFPRSAGYGLEGSALLDVRLVGGLAVRGRASYQRSVFRFAPQPNGPRSETGAVDTYVTAGLGLSYTY